MGGDGGRVEEVDKLWLEARLGVRGGAAGRQQVRHLPGLLLQVELAVVLLRHRPVVAALAVDRGSWLHRREHWRIARPGVRAVLHLKHNSSVSQSVLTDQSDHLTTTLSLRPSFSQL